MTRYIITYRLKVLKVLKIHFSRTEYLNLNLIRIFAEKTKVVINVFQRNSDDKRLFLTIKFNDLKFRIRAAWELKYFYFSSFHQFLEHRPRSLSKINVSQFFTFKKHFKYQVQEVVYLNFLIKKFFKFEFRMSTISSLIP